MRQEYLDYWKKNNPPCVGLSRIGGYGKRWSTCHADGSTKNCSMIWNYIPDRFIHHNRKGICLKWQR